MNLKKLGIIISREYLNKVQKKSFLLITFLAPILFAAICILPSVIMLTAKEEAKKIGVVDQSGIVLPFLTDNEVTRFVDLGPDADIEAIKGDLGASGIDVLLTISGIDADNAVSAACYSEKPLGVDTGGSIENKINDAVEQFRIDSYNIENLKDIMSSVRADIHLKSYTIDKSGKETISESTVYMAISMILGIMLYMFIAMFSAMVMSSVIEEKASRVVEVLVSSVKATELMFGKIIGVALVALTQFFLWIVLTGAILLVAGGIIGMDKIKDTLGENPQETVSMMTGMPSDMAGMDSVASMGIHPDFSSAGATGMDAIIQTLGNINVPMIAISFLLYFILGYLLYASLFAAIGSGVENEGDSNQLQLPVTIPLMLGFFVALYAFKAPDSSLVFWFSMIPFTSPIVMLARIPFGVALWELIVSIVVLALTFVGCAWASAKIYKVGILMYGKKSTFKDLWKWLKQK